MKIVRFEAAGKTRYGVLDGTHILEYSGTPYGTFKKARKRYQVTQPVLLAPVVPSKIVAGGPHYPRPPGGGTQPAPRDPGLIPNHPSALPRPDVPMSSSPRPNHA